MLRSIALTAALIVAPAVAQAQSAPQLRPVLSVSSGVSQFDLSGTGSTPTVAVRLERAIGARWLLGEAGVTVLRPREQDETWRTYAVPEVQLQVQLPAALVRPYLGAGAGWFRQLSGDGPAFSEMTLSGAAGVRVASETSRLGGRAELRVRGIGTGFEGAAAEWTAGLSWRW